jgi:hypothetical protein
MMIATRLDGLTAIRSVAVTPALISSEAATTDIARRDIILRGALHSDRAAT